MGLKKIACRGFHRRGDTLRIDSWDDGSLVLTIWDNLRGQDASYILEGVQIDQFIDAFNKSKDDVRENKEA